MIVYFYKYIFYKLYKLAVKSEKSWKDGGIPQWVALIVFSILLLINVLTLLGVFSKFFEYPIVLNRVTGLVIMLVIYVFNYMVFIQNKKYKNIVNIIDLNNNRLGWNILFFLYLFLTFFAFVFPALR